MTNRRPQEEELKIEIVEEREMTEQEVETVASILFGWWKREFEGRRSEESHS